MGSFGGIELDDVEIEGERLILRRWRAEDADDVVTIMQDRSMHEFLALPDPYTLRDAIAYVTSVGHEGRPEGTGLGCAVVERATGRLVGSAALRLSGDAEIGYWIAPAAQGHGYAAEATRLLTAWGFRAGLTRVLLASDIRNLASVRTAMAAGFGYEGVARQGIATASVDGAPPRRADLARFARLATDVGERGSAAVAPLPAAGLTDGVLRLRMLAPGDAEALIQTEDAVATGWGFTGQPPDRDSIRALAARAGLDWLVGGPARVAMVDERAGSFAGDVSVRLAGPPQVGGLGYAVHPSFRGRGYTARALRLLVPWAFAPPGEGADLARLELGAKVGNLASQRAALAAGFHPDGTNAVRLRNPDGTFGDEVRFALTNPRYA